MATATQAVATQEVFAHSDEATEIWTVPSATPKGALVKEGDAFGITLTRAAGGDAVDTIELGPYKVTGKKTVGVSNEAVEAIAAPAVGITLNGTWEFENVNGADLTTAQRTPVYVTPGGALTLTATSNTKVGVVNYPGTYAKVAGTLPVKIGA